MTALAHPEVYLTEDEYLAGEAASPVKHEYLNGVVYAMAGGSPIHSLIAVNLLRRLGNQLEGKPCRPFNSDMKLRIRQGLDRRHYYPDAMVVCQPQLRDPWQENPTVLFEVISPETERTDRGEKLSAYQSIASLQSYVLIHSESVAAVVHTRTEDGWETRLLRAPEDVIELPSIGCRVPLAQLYESTGMV